MDAINARQVTITNVASDQCALWLCRRIPLRRGDYCSKSCLDDAISYSKSTYPFRIATVFSSTTEFAPVATEILNLLKANKESGVPRPSQDVFTIPPWQSTMFTAKFDDPREDYCEWLFIGPFQIPKTSDFNWIGGCSKMIGEVRHCVFKPFPREDDKWKLHQYSNPEDMMGKAVYVMHCNKEGRAIKPVKIRNWPQEDKHIQVPLSAEDEQTDCFLRLYSELEGLERAVASFALAPQNVDKKSFSASLSEEIHLQMENVKSHLVADKGKLNNLGLEANHSKVKRESEGMHKTDSFARLNSESESFQRAIAFFALAREDVEKKLKSGAEQKTPSEILASVSKEIHMQMENIKSHILTNGSNSKARRLESDS